MGNTYCVLPLNRRNGRMVGDAAQDLISNDNRNPTPREVAKVLAGLEDYVVEVTANPSQGSWYAQIDWKADRKKGPWTQIYLRNYYGDDDEPHEFVFTGAWAEPVFVILERLSHFCGPFIFFDANTPGEIVVAPGADPRDLLEAYHRNAEPSV